MAGAPAGGMIIGAGTATTARSEKSSIIPNGPGLTPWFSRVLREGRGRIAERLAVFVSAGVH
jgi:hypothetical protein